MSNWSTEDKGLGLTSLDDKDFVIPTMPDIPPGVAPGPLLKAMQPEIYYLENAGYSLKIREDGVVTPYTMARYQRMNKT